MAYINHQVQRQLDLYQVRVFYITGKVCRWYNKQRQDKLNDVCLLGGWYWMAGSKEHGPFRTVSGAKRDCYYRLILNRAPPGLTEDEVRAVEAELRRKARSRRGRAPVIGELVVSWL